MSASSQLFRQRAIAGHGGAQFLATMLITQHLAGRFGQAAVNRHQSFIFLSIRHLGEKLKA